MSLTAIDQQPAPAHADVIRMTLLKVARLATRDDGESDGRTLEGYAAVFDEWTEIDSWWEGHFLERLDPGSFDNTLVKRGDRVKVLYDHGFDPSIGNKPLGKPERMEPDKTGLWTETPLARTSYNDDLIELLRSEAIDGMSFRFSVKEEHWDDEPEASDTNPKGLAERTLLAVDLFEFGPVTFPAYEATTAGVRSADVYQQWRRNPQGFLIPDAGPEKVTAGTPDDSRREHLSDRKKRAKRVSLNVDSRRR